MYRLIITLESGEQHTVAEATEIEEVVKVQRTIDVAVCRWANGEKVEKPAGLKIDWPLLETCQPYIFDESGKAVGFVEPNGMVWLAQKRGAS